MPSPLRDHATLCPVGVTALCATASSIVALVGIDGGYVRLGGHLQCLTLPGCGGVWARHFDDLSRVYHRHARRRWSRLGRFMRLMPSPLRDHAALHPCRGDRRSPPGASRDWCDQQHAARMPPSRTGRRSQGGLNPASGCGGVFLSRCRRQEDKAPPTNVTYIRDLGGQARV